MAQFREGPPGRKRDQWPVREHAPPDRPPPAAGQALDALQEPLPAPFAICQLPDMELPDTDPE